MNEYEYCQELLAKAKVHPNGCMVTQGTVQENGFIHIKFNGKQWWVHRFVALYHVERDLAAITNLMRFKVYQTCGLTICINPQHLEFSTKKPEKKWEPRVDWWLEPAEYRY